MKGYQGEREFAQLTGGRRIPASGAAIDFPNDVELPNGWLAEVKRRKSGFKTIYDWLEDTREEPDCLACRSDHKQWIVFMTLPKFVELLESHIKSLEESK